MLPHAFQVPFDAATRGDSGQFDWAKERLRVLSANTPGMAIREYEDLRRNNPKGLSDAQRYGLALAHMRNSDAPVSVMHELSALLEDHPGNLWVALALGEAETRAGQAERANKRFEALLHEYPDNRPIVLTYAGLLNEQATATAGRRAQQILEPLARRAADDPVFQQTYARASELAGSPHRASEAYAEAAFLNGRAEQALIQLQALKNQDLDYVTRARVDARIAAITPTVLELRRQGVRDPELSR